MQTSRVALQVVFTWQIKWITTLVGHPGGDIKRLLKLKLQLGQKNKYSRMLIFLKILISHYIDQKVTYAI